MAETLDVSALIPNRFEPIRKNQWVFALEGIDSYLIKGSARPEITIGEVVIDFINSKRYLMGKHEFGTLPLTLYDAIAPSGAQQVMEWIRVHYEAVSGRAGYADFYKRDAQLKMLDPIGTVVQLWDLKGVFITAANFNELSYDAADPTEINLTLRYDAAIMQF